MNCREAQGLLEAYVDGELDLVRSLDTEAHARECAVCAAALDRLQALRCAIAAHAPYYAAPAALRKKVAMSLAPQSRWTFRWPVLAAACLVGLTLIFVAPSLFHQAPGGVEREVVAAHVRSMLAEHLVDVPSSDRHTVKPWFAGKLDFAPDVPDLSAQGFTLAGGRLDYVDGRTVAALIYRRRQHTINVFTWPAAGADESPRAGSARGFHLVHWVRHGMAWWAVSDLAAEELAELPGLL